MSERSMEALTHEEQTERNVEFPVPNDEFMGEEGSTSISDASFLGEHGDTSDRSSSTSVEDVVGTDAEVDLR